MEDYAKRLVIIVLLSLLVKIFLLPLFIDDRPPYLSRFDMAEFVSEGKCVLEGGILYSGTDLTRPCFSVHGPSFGYLMALAVKIFGENYLLKLPSIFFETLSILVFFKIGKMLFGARASLFFTFVYSFSYLPLVSGMTGNDDPIFMFFVLLATFFLFKNQEISSAVSLAIAATFKVTPLLFVPAFFLAIHSKSGIKKSIRFILVFGTLLSAVLLPFYLQAGNLMLQEYSGRTIAGLVDNYFLSFLNIVRLSERIITYLLYQGVSNQDAFQAFINNIFAPLILKIGLLSAGCYIVLKPLKRADLEFLRNVIITVLFVLLTSTVTVPDYVNWFLPFFYLLLGTIYSKNFKSGIIQKRECLGAALTVCGIFLYAIFFTESWDKLTLRTYISWLPFVLTAMGAYMMFSRIPRTERLLWAGLMLSLSMFWNILANPLLVFKPIIERMLPAALATREVVVSSAGVIVKSSFVVDLLYLPYLFITIILFTVCASLLAYKVHKLGEEYGGTRKWQTKKLLEYLRRR